jgi:hypothetical protein
MSNSRRCHSATETARRLLIHGLHSALDRACLLTPRLPLFKWLYKRETGYAWSLQHEDLYADIRIQL